MKKFSWRGLSIVIFICVTAFYLAPLAIPNLPEWWAKNKLNLFGFTRWDADPAGSGYQRAFSSRCPVP
jgi:hypothetical protein